MCVDAHACISIMYYYVYSYFSVLSIGQGPHLCTSSKTALRYVWINMKTIIHSYTVPATVIACGHACTYVYAHTWPQAHHSFHHSPSHHFMYPRTDTTNFQYMKTLYMDAEEACLTL